MIVYIEKKYLNSEITKHILSFYKESDILIIDNYKNIFDKNISGKTEKSIIIAGINNSILKTPFGYGHKGEGYFLKNSINCIYDCSYCFLKGAFKNDFLLYFVNYDSIKNEILEKVNSTKNTIRFYSSDYSDNLATDDITNFTKEFVPFFSNLKNAKMEIRTKSAKINNLLKLEPTKNIEIAFSLNPSEIIKNYEFRTTSLEKRIESINKLIDAGWQVGIRFMPLLDIENYKIIYNEFLDYVTKNIDFSKIYSIFIGGLMYTNEDYNKMIAKYPYLDILYKLEKNNDGFYRENLEVRKRFYDLFRQKFIQKECNICLDEI